MIIGIWVWIERARSALRCSVPWKGGLWTGVALGLAGHTVLTLLVRPGSRSDSYRFRGHEEVWGWEGQQCSQPSQVCILAATSHLGGHGQASLHLHTCDAEGDGRTFLGGTS